MAPWRRPGLRVRDRRIISIGCCALAGADRPLEMHLVAAQSAGDHTGEDLRIIAEEFRHHTPDDAGRTPRRAKALR